MIEIAIPGRDPLRLTTALLDFNGTLACDGCLLAGVADRLRALAEHLGLHVVTGDSTGTAREALAGLPLTVTVMPAERQGAAKHAFLASLDPRATVVIGNGSNDREVIEHAALSIAVLGSEGCAIETLVAADIACARIEDALDLLLVPLRVVATLRR